MDNYNTTAWYQPGFNIPATPNMDSLIRPHVDGSFNVIVGDGVVDDYACTIVTPERRVIVEYVAGENLSLTPENKVQFDMPANILDGGETAILQIKYDNKITERAIAMQEVS